MNARRRRLAKARRARVRCWRLYLDACRAMIADGVNQSFPLRDYFRPA